MNFAVEYIAKMHPSRSQRPNPSPRTAFCEQFFPAALKQLKVNIKLKVNIT